MWGRAVHALCSNAIKGCVFLWDAVLETDSLNHHQRLNRITGCLLGSQSPSRTSITLVSSGIKVWAAQRLPKVFSKRCPFCSSVAHTGIYSIVQTGCSTSSVGFEVVDVLVLSVVFGAVQAFNTRAQVRIKCLIISPKLVCIGWDGKPYYKS